MKTVYPLSLVQPLAGVGHNCSNVVLDQRSKIFSKKSPVEGSPSNAAGINPFLFAWGLAQYPHRLTFEQNPFEDCWSSSYSR